MFSTLLTKEEQRKDRDSLHILKDIGISFNIDKAIYFPI